MNTLYNLGMIAVGLSLAAPVFAQNENKQPQGNNIHARVLKQGRRIDRKVAKGKMTEEQAGVERNKLTGIEQKRLEMTNNGQKPLTQAERKELKKELRQTGKEIKAAGASAAPAASPAVAK